MSAAEPRLVVLGKQGAGKGTQAARLAGRYTIRHISTGDMFRQQAALGTAFGLKAKRFMDRGELVPDEIVIGVVEESLVEGGPLANGFVLDGFPRTLDQAKELDRVLDRKPIDLAIDLKVPREVVLDRIAVRRVREQRDDDTVEAVERRLELYERETVPICDYYAGHGVLATVDGVGESDEVFDRLVQVVDALADRDPEPGWAAAAQAATRLAPTLVGLSLATATQLAEEQEVILRVVIDEGAQRRVTRDRRPNRINIQVQDGTVVSSEAY